MYSRYKAGPTRTPLKILINALSARLGGGVTYINNLLEAMPQRQQLFVIMLIQPDFRQNISAFNLTYLTVNGVQNPFRRRLWEQANLKRLVRQYNIDVFFSPGGLLPNNLPKSVRTAITFQNMLPFDLTQRNKYFFSYRWLRDVILKWKLTQAMETADLTIFISNYARDVIQRKFKIQTRDSIVIPHGLADIFKVSKQLSADKPRWMPEGKTFVYVSFIDRYKNQLEIVQGFKAFIANGGSGTLLLIGAGYRPYIDLVKKEIIDLDLTKFVRLVGNLNHEELASVYKHAEINIFASATENCPNILLEMMGSGRPALVSNLHPMIEFAEDTVTYFDSSNPLDLAAKIEECLTDTDKKSRLASAALKKSEKFTWKKTSCLTWSSLENLD